MFSIIIPIYKPQQHTYDCIKCLQAQTMCKADFEVLCILNGPKDGYNDLDMYLKSTTLNYSLYYSPLASVSNARNIGINRTKGEYIVFIDDDDIVSNSYLDELKKNAEKDSIVLTNVRNFKDDIRSTFSDYLTISYKKNHNLSKPTIYQSRSHFSTVCAKIIPINIIKDYRFKTYIPIGEDCLFMAVISHRCKKIKYAKSDAIYYRRVRNTSVTLSRDIKNETKNSFYVLFNYCKYWLLRPLSYNFSFMINRVGSALLWFVRSIFKINY